MAELLVRVEDKPVGETDKQTLQRTMSGYVIAVRDDGWPWSDTERKATFWRIISVPGEPAANYEHLLKGDDINLVEFARRRQMKLDLKLDPTIDASVTAVRKDGVTSDCVATKLQIETISTPVATSPTRTV